MRVLIVEDEPTLASALARTLENRGFVTDVAHDGENGAFLGETETYDAVVLDLGLPVLDGLSVLRSWRAHGRTMPVLILTARSGWTEKVAGFESGADDFLAKPFEMEEVVYRLKALIRRSVGLASPIVTVGPLTYDTGAARGSINGRTLELTAQETRILEYLLLQSGRTVSRTEIIEHVYDRAFDLDSNVIDVLIARLRKKIGLPLIHTVRGLGYRLADEENAR